MPFKPERNLSASLAAPVQPGKPWLGDDDIAALLGALDGSVILATTDPGGRITAVNERFCAISGYSRAELLGQDHRILNSGLHPKSFFQGMWETIRAKKVWRGQIRNRAKHGDYYWVDTIIAPILDPGGSHKGYLSVRVDITELVHAQDQLQESLALTHAILDSSPIGISVYERWSGQCVMANGAMARVIGGTASEVLQQNFKAIPSWQRSGLLRLAEEALVGGIARQMDVHTATTFGKDVWIRCNQAPVGQGVATHLLTLVQDISEAKQAEVALRSSEERLRLVVEASGVGIWDIDLRSRQGYLSDRVGAFLEIPGGSIPHALDVLRAAMHPEDGPRFQEALLAHLNGEGALALALRMRRGDEYRVYFIRGEAQRDEHGAPYRLVGTLSDITERSLQEESLRQTQKLESLGLLAGGIAHDFNNLLTAIRGNLELASLRLPRGHEAAENFSLAEIAVDRAADLTRQLLAYSGQGDMHRKPMDLNALVLDMARILSVSLPAGTEIEWDLGEGLPPTLGDQAQLQQVVMNLITNAADAQAEKGGAITLRTRGLELSPGDARLQCHPSQSLSPGRYVVLEVRDTGCGMTPEVLARIFDPFFTTKAKGRGLGLSAMLGIVRRHQGNIQVTSEPGVGTAFALCFPAARLGEGPG